MNAPLRSITLEDKYALTQGRVFLTGTQALVRLLFLQHQRDAIAGLNTAGYVSGYRGSPLGGLDQALWKAKPHLAKNQVVFQPGVNEDLAATALWGTQQVGLSPGAKVMRCARPAWLVVSSSQYSSRRTEYGKTRGFFLVRAT